jgi:glycosyltransferase involved in cell wall biosynthesis
MKILFITTRLPHAGVASGHIIVYQRMLRLVQNGHQVGLAAFDANGDMRNVADVRPMLVDLKLVDQPPHAGALRRLVQFMFSSIPPFFLDYRSRDMMQRVGDMVERSHYDVVLAEFSVMGQYLYRNPFLPAVRKIVSCHSGIAASYRKLAAVMPFRPRGIGSNLSLRGLLRYELSMYRAADRVLVLTNQERYNLLNYAPHLRISVIPPGVDTAHIIPAAAAPREISVLFTGHMGTEDNRDAARWFAHTVWPRVKAMHPELSFIIVGPETPPDLLELARKDPSIRVTGEVADVRPYLQKATVFVCPVRLGSGFRVKVLEAMAAGLPVVTTLLGGEGIPIQPGDNAFIADRPEMMAQYIDLLLSDEALRQTMGRQARALVVERFSWDRGIRLLDDVLRDVMVQS